MLNRPREILTAAPPQPGTLNVILPAPVPRQASHTWGLVTVISFSHPRVASSKVISMS